MITDVLPVSFTYGGSPFPNGFIKSTDGNDTVFTHADGLEFRFKSDRYADTGAVEWTGWFENTGNGDSAQIKDINALDITLDCPGGKAEAGVIVTVSFVVASAWNSHTA